MTDKIDSGISTGNQIARHELETVKDKTEIETLPETTVTDESAIAKVRKAMVDGERTRVKVAKLHFNHGKNPREDLDLPGMQANFTKSRIFDPGCPLIVALIAGILEVLRGFRRGCTLVDMRGSEDALIRQVYDDVCPDDSVPVIIVHGLTADEAMIVRNDWAKDREAKRIDKWEQYNAYQGQLLAGKYAEGQDLAEALGTSTNNKNYQAWKAFFTLPKHYRPALKAMIKMSTPERNKAGVTLKPEDIITLGRIWETVSVSKTPAKFDGIFKRFANGKHPESKEGAKVIKAAKEAADAGPVDRFPALREVCNQYESDALTAVLNLVCDNDGEGLGKIDAVFTAIESTRTSGKKLKDSIAECWAPPCENPEMEKDGSEPKKV